VIFHGASLPKYVKRRWIGNAQDAEKSYQMVSKWVGMMTVLLILDGAFVVLAFK